MATINTITDLQVDQEWTDETLLKLLLDMLEENGEDAVERALTYLKDRAAEVEERNDEEDGA